MHKRVYEEEGGRGREKERERGREREGERERLSKRERWDGITICLPQTALCFAQAIAILSQVSFFLLLQSPYTIDKQVQARWAQGLRSAWHPPGVFTIEGQVVGS